MIPHALLDGAVGVNDRATGDQEFEVQVTADAIQRLLIGTCRVIASSQGIGSRNHGLPLALNHPSISQAHP